MPLRRRLRRAAQRLVGRLVRTRAGRRLLLAASALLAPRHRVGVMIVPIAPDGRVLLVRPVLRTRSDWTLPGGWLERGEEPGNGARRELAEETGIDVELGPVVALAREPAPDHLPIAFAARAAAAEEPRPGLEILEARWFAAGELPRDLDPFMRRAVEAAVAWHVASAPHPPR